jgi:hypothetical protein
MGCSAQIECERKHIICEQRKSVVYDLRMGWKSVYTVKDGRWMAADEVSWAWL